MPFKFIHTADIHLDSPLRTLALRNGDLAELIGNATRQVFTNIVTLCIEENVDALLIAGDLYDGDQTSMKTARFLAQQMRRLDAAGILTFVIRGNHDAVSKITRELVLPDSVKVFSGRAEAVSVPRADGQQPVVIHGLSFAKPKAPDSLLPKYPAPKPDAFNIALMHTSLAGSEGHDAYAPCKLADLHQSGHQYWALGHIHKHAIYETSDNYVVMAGIPQGRDINESGPKSVTLVTCTDDGKMQLEQRSTSIAEFARLEVSIDGLDDLRDVDAAVTEQLRLLRHNTESEHLVARVIFTGVASVAWLLRRDTDFLKTQIDDCAAQISNTWIDKIELQCRVEPEQVPEHSTTPSANPLSELAELVSDTIIPSSAFAEEVATVVKQLRSQLPRECRDVLGTDEQREKEILVELSRHGAEDVASALRATASEQES